MFFCCRTIGLIAIAAGVLLLMLWFMPVGFLIFLAAVLLIAVGLLCLNSR